MAAQLHEITQLREENADRMKSLREVASRLLETKSGRTWRDALLHTEERIQTSRAHLAALWDTHAEQLIHLRTKPAAFQRTAVGMAHIALSIDEEEHNLSDLIEYRDWVAEVIREQRGAQ